MDERPEHTRAGESFQVDARHSKAQSEAPDAVDEELASDESIDVDAGVRTLRRVLAKSSPAAEAVALLRPRRQ